MSADEMFKKLGYELKQENERGIEYELETFDIVFDLKNKTISFWGIDNSWLDVSDSEMKAIYKKIEELGWL